MEDYSVAQIYKNIKSVFPKTQMWDDNGSTAVFKAEIATRTVTFTFDRNENTVRIDFAWNYGNSYDRNANLQAGSLNLARSLRTLARRLYLDGYRVIANGADPELDNAYRKNLEKIGFSRTRAGHYEHALTFQEYLFRKNHK
jgi:hypothetical protein